MRGFLYGISALAYWLAYTGRLDMPVVRAGDAAASGQNAAPGIAEGARVLFPHLGRPLHVLVPDATRVRAKGFACHRSSAAFAGGSFHLADEVLGVCSPELCFVQVAKQFPFHQAVKAGCALCGSFAISPKADFGLVARQPLATKAALEKYLAENGGISGAKAARKALRYVVEGCASPAEIYLAMVLTLLYAKGGFALPGFRSNCSVELGKRAAKAAARSKVIPDLLNVEHRIAIEYDADITHASGQRRMHDATKRMVLESMGFKVVTVTTRQLASSERMRDVAREVRKHMGLPFRVKSAEFDRNHRLLQATRKSFDGLYNPQWLAGHF